MSVDIAKAVSAAKKTRGPKKGAKRGARKAADGRKPVEKAEGKFKAAVEVDWSQFRCPKEADFEDVLHFQQTRLSFLKHEVADAESKVSALSSQTYEERNAAALRAKEEQRDKAAMSRIFDEEKIDNVKLEEMKKRIAELEAKMAAKALQG